MKSCFGKSEDRQSWLRLACIAVAGLGAAIAAGDRVGAAGERGERSVASVESRIPGEPIMAVVSLRSQQITVYDANGWILRAPVSSGQKGRETPAGIFSIIEKQAEHYSNLYDDAYMPHMQRVTWSGIALHGGVLPGHPASHGCVRMPYDFAERLFDVTRLGMRVIIAPTDVAPVAISHPALSALFQPKSDAAAVAAARAAEAAEAANRANQARLAVAMAFRDVAQATVPVRVAERLRLRALEQMEVVEREIAAAESTEAKERAQDARAAAAARLEEAEAKLAAAKAELQPKLDAVAPARDAAAAAESGRLVANEAARKTARALEPVSVFISRKTQRLYIRQAFQPVLEIPITIQDPDRPIGTHVFTALEDSGGATQMKWSVVSLDSAHPEVSMVVRQPTSSDPVAAKAALERIVISQDTFDGIAATPRSSLIISDEALSKETGNGTEFVVVMSGEPQGGLKARHGAPRDFPFWRSPFSGRYFPW